MPSLMFKKETFITSSCFVYFILSLTFECLVENSAGYPVPVSGRIFGSGFQMGRISGWQDIRANQYPVHPY
jgi:hypothetical protein